MAMNENRTTDFNGDEAGPASAIAGLGTELPAGFIAEGFVEALAALVALAVVLDLLDNASWDGFADAEAVSDA